MYTNVMFMVWNFTSVDLKYLLLLFYTFKSVLTGYAQGSGILHYAHGDGQKTHLIQQGKSINIPTGSLPRCGSRLDYPLWLSAPGTGQAKCPHVGHCWYGVLGYLAELGIEGNLWKFGIYETNRSSWCCRGCLLGTLLGEVIWGFLSWWSLVCRQSKHSPPSFK